MNTSRARSPGWFTTNKRGYTFGVRITLGRSTLDVPFGTKKLDADTYEVIIDGDTYKVNLGHPESLDPIVTNLANSMRNVVLEHEMTSATRFEP